MFLPWRISQGIINAQFWTLVLLFLDYGGKVTHLFFIWKVEGRKNECQESRCFMWKSSWLNDTLKSPWQVEHAQGVLFKTGLASKIVRQNSSCVSETVLQTFQSFCAWLIGHRVLLTQCCIALRTCYL